MPLAAYPRVSLTARGGQPHPLLFGLAPDGVYRAQIHYWIWRWALTPPFHPCLASRSLRRSVFCGTFRRLTAPGCYPASCPTVPGLSSPHHKMECDHPAFSDALKYNRTKGDCQPYQHPNSPSHQYHLHPIFRDGAWQIGLLLRDT